MLYLNKPNDFWPKHKVVSCLICRNNNYLFLKRAANDTFGELWGVPTGKVNAKETLIHAMIREIHEETGIKMMPDNLNFNKTFYVSHNDWDFEYHLFTTVLNFPPEIRLNHHEHSSYQWCSLQDSLKLPLVPDMDTVIRHFMKDLK